MEYRFNLDEVLNLIQDAIKDGYHYGSLEVVGPDDERDQSGAGAALWLICDNCGGEEGVEYELVESVPLAEVAAYGNRGQEPAPDRRRCKAGE